ncbi:MAG TPA: hypothetical protein VFM17_09170 [Candidatus Eisenbacteria bacterium]|nr:hypothetical protein [Candidatus Eisenbacteria bacterium]
MNSTTSATAAPRRNDRRFYTVMAVLIALIVFAGFAPSFYLRPLFESRQLTGLLIVHGILFSAWITLLVVQVRLVAAKRTDIHRKLGVAGGLLAAAMVVVGVLAAIYSAKRGFSPQGAPPPLSFMLISMTDMIVFPALVGTALAFRRRTDVHKRLMLVATLSITVPALARIPFVSPFGLPAFFGLADLLIVGSMVYDRARNGRFHPAYVWGLVFVVVSQVLRIALAGSPGWLAIAGWLTQ